MKKTRLYPYQKKLGARMIEFFGWEMPVEYRGIVDEHLAVRRFAGLFDVSHMGEIVISGKDALAFLQCLTPNDVSRLSMNQAQYTVLTTPRGTFVDDLLVYRIGENAYLLVVNAANTRKDFEWILSHKSPYEVSVENVSDSYTQIALQGPLSSEVLRPLTDVDLDSLKPFWSAQGKVAGEEVLVSRTGYTGEDGFELYTLSAEPGVIWEAILEEGGSRGLLSVGLGARDTLRLEAKLMLYGNDIDETTTVLEADLKWIVKFKKGDFLGRDALQKQLEEGIGRKIVGFELLERGIARPHHPVYIDGKRVSEVCSGYFSPWLKKSIGLTYLPVEFTEIGTEFDVDIRGKKVKAVVVPTPFYRRADKSWDTSAGEE